jgi:6-phosphogluconate dehydrogenase
MNGSIVLDWLVGGGALAVVGFSIATYVRADKQIGRVYQRMDEKTDQMKNEAVKKEVCEVVHKNLDEKLKDIQQKTACIPDIKAGIDILLRNGDGK